MIEHNRRQFSLIKVKKKLSRKPVLLVISVAFVVIFIWLVWSRSNTTTPQQTNKQTETTPQQSAETKQRLRVIATGDVIPHDALNAAAKTNGDYNYLQFMDNLKPYFDAADVRFCNQAVLGAGERYGIRGYPVFNSPTQVARDMQKLGCSVINTGSNHTNDLSQAEINASVAVWDELPDMLAVAGANRSEIEKNKIRYFEKNGVSFAFLSYSTYTNKPGKTNYGLTMFSERFARQQLREARKRADIVMVSMRWGTEYSPTINAQQNTQAQFLADNGADLVFGHGPHVLEPVKKLKGKNNRPTYVWFSLGNFLNAQLEIKGLVNGLAVIDIDPKSKTISNIGYLPTYMHYEWSAAEKAREDLMARKSFEMFLLEDADKPLQKSQHNTTVEAQQQYLKSILNTYTTVPLLSGKEYLER